MFPIFFFSCNFYQFRLRHRRSCQGCNDVTKLSESTKVVEPLGQRVSMR